MINTYIFDLNDIIDNSIYSRMYNELINELLSNLKISEVELQKIISKVKDTGKKVDTYKLCKKLNSTELYYKILGKYAKHTYSLKTKEIPAVFRKIKDADKKIGVISNSQQRTIELFLNRFNLLEYVDFIESGDKSTVLFWISLEKKHNIDKEYSMVIDNFDEILDTAEHVGYKVLNVKEISDVKKFNL